MKFFTNQSNSKKIIISLLVVMVFNFISPTISSAEIDGGILFDPIAELLTAIGDFVMEGLQYYFMGRRDITKEPVPDSEYDEYIISYSPGVIFSGKVAFFKTNFINAKSDEKEILEVADYEYEHIKTLDTSEVEDTGEMRELWKDELKNCFSPDEDIVYGYRYQDPDVTDGEFTETDLVWMWEHNGEIYIALMIDAWMSEEDAEEIGLVTTYSLAKNAVIAHIARKGITWAITKGASKGLAAGLAIPTVGDELITVAVMTVIEVGLYVFQMSEDTETTLEDTIVYKRTTIIDVGDSKESSAFKLKNTVGTWYVTLRTIALVGLLSVLVYIGIRILISTTGQEKAKYKKMIIDWAAAICILFVLHYIMLFITEITQKITNILSVKLIDTDGRDIFMTMIRQQVELEYDSSFVSIVMYLTLIVYTIIFTVQYIKRFLYVAFFTIISPLVALTYPLDKVKDGQAQAFSVWFREYLFNSLLQPMHLLLYYIFVDAAIILSVNNPIYAIVAIGFLLPAEKLFRKMFGFDKAESASQVKAAVGGALVVNALKNTARKVGNVTGKLASGGKSGSSGGTGKDTSNSKGTGNKGKSTPRYASSHKNDNANKNNNINAKTNTNTSTNLSKNNNKTFNQDVKKAGDKGKVNLKNGVKTLAGRYNPLNKANRGKILKGTGRIARKAIVGAAGAATLGTVGLAIGTATGDASKALGYAGAGAGAGFVAANNLGDRATEFGKKNRELYKEGALGTDEYNTINSIKELTNDNDFNRTCKALGVKDQKGREEIIRQFHSNGITSSEDIKKSMQIRAKTGATQDEVIAAYKIKERAEADKLERQDIEKRLTRQGVKGDKLNHAMNIIDKFYD